MFGRIHSGAIRSRAFIYWEIFDAVSLLVTGLIYFLLCDSVLVDFVFLGIFILGYSVFWGIIIHNTIFFISIIIVVIPIFPSSFY